MNRSLTEHEAVTTRGCMIEEELQRQIEEFIKRHGISATTFGLWAMNDSRFVFDLRDGRACLSKTIRRVHLFMKDYDVKRGSQSALVSPPSISSIRKRADSVKLLTTSRIVE